MVVQVGGKLRSHHWAPFGTDPDIVVEGTRTDPKVRPYLDGKQIVKIIKVPDKLVNFVVKG